MNCRRASGALSEEMRTAAALAYKRFYDRAGGRGRPMRHDVGPVLRKSELRDSQLLRAWPRKMHRPRPKP